MALKYLGLKVILEGNNEIKLHTDEYPIFLHETSAQDEGLRKNVAHMGLSFETRKLLPTIDLFRDWNIKVHDLELERNGVGIAIPFEDPSGNVLHLIEVQIRDVPPFEGLRLYNSGMSVSSMSKAMDFYENILGFKEWSRNYLPKALPLMHQDGTFAFMIHNDTSLNKNSAEYGIYPQITLLLIVPDLIKYQNYLTSRDIVFFKREDFIVVRDPEGNLIEILQKAIGK
jgi:catechol 2,3-dioxygenase-like lactoylglutathione lyase family enzyme